MGLMFGIFIGLTAGAVLGAAISFPIGSAVGILIDKSFGGWAIGIEIALFLLCTFIIFKYFRIHFKKGPKKSFTI